MIREVARCPYCLGGVIAVDDDQVTVVFDPGRVGGTPCSHLAFASIGLGVYDGDNGKLVEQRGGEWVWVRGEGLRQVPSGRLDRLTDYLDMLACDLLPDGESRPAVEYQVTGATAGEREEAHPGTGEFSLPNPGNGPPFDCLLDGWGFYAPAPEALVEAVHPLVGRS
jgi:hypothetical protein